MGNLGFYAIIIRYLEKIFPKNNKNCPQLLCYQKKKSNVVRKTGSNLNRKLGTSSWCMWVILSSHLQENLAKSNHKTETKTSMFGLEWVGRKERIKNNNTKNRGPAIKAAPTWLTNCIFYCYFIKGNWFLNVSGG